MTSSRWELHISSTCRRHESQRIKSRLLSWFWCNKSEQVSSELPVGENPTVMCGSIKFSATRLVSVATLQNKCLDLRLRSPARPVCCRWERKIHSSSVDSQLCIGLIWCIKEKKSWNLFFFCWENALRFTSPLGQIFFLFAAHLWIKGLWTSFKVYFFSGWDLRAALSHKRRRHSDLDVRQWDDPVGGGSVCRWGWKAAHSAAARS